VALFAERIIRSAVSLLFLGLDLRLDPSYTTMMYDRMIACRGSYRSCMEPEARP
jgi:hypothetical protein